MTAPPREGPALIRPTVGPPSSRAADRLLRASMFPLILGVCGGMLAMLHHRMATAITVAVAGTAAAAVLAAAGGYLAARAMRFNPWPAAMGIITVAGLVATAILPRAGLAGLRILVVIGAAGGLAITGYLAQQYHRRRLVYHRWAQALTDPLSQRIDQKEQVLAGLTRTTRMERVAAPHYGAAPNAAWYLQPVQWAGLKIKVMVLKLPAHGDITTQEFLDSIRDALTRRAAVEFLRLDPDPLRDEITITVLDGPEVVEEEELDRQAQAIEAAKATAGDFLKGVKVTILDWAEGDENEPEDAGPAWPIQRMEITFERNFKLTAGQNRQQFAVHLGEQLYGDPAILRARWNLPQGRVLVHKRATFPALVPHHPLDTAALFGKVVVVVYGYDEEGNLAFIQLSHTDAPHFLITGGTGTGKSVLLRIIAIDAARQGMEVRGCDPKRIEMKGLRGWPNVTRIATRVKEMIKLIEDTYDDMNRRYAAIEEDRAREEDYQRILLIIDEFLMLSMIINDYWAEERVRLGGQQPKEHPVMRKLRGLVVMARGGVMNLVLATQRGDADIFPDGIRDSIGGRVALGRQTQESAKMMFGDTTVGRDISQQSQGVGTTLTTDGPVRVKVEWLPDPSRYPDDFKPEDGDLPFQRDLLLAMLPPGSTWGGPQPYQPSEPDSAPAEALAGGRLEVRLLFCARFAMQWYHEAHLTDGDTGGMPGGLETPASYGWRPGPDGELRPCGKWIGCIAGPPDDRRVFLHPASVLEVASRIAAEVVGGPAFERAAVDTALLQAGLLRHDTDGEGRRWVVLRAVPGNDLRSKDRRQRVWDIPADELLGDSAELTEPAARPVASQAASSRALPPGPQKLPSDLEDGDRIILMFEDHEVVEAVVYSVEADPTVATAPEPDGTGRYVINYCAAEGGTPDSVRARADHPIRLAAGDDGAGTRGATTP